MCVSIMCRLMSIDEVVAAIKLTLGDRLLDLHWASDKRCYLTVDPEVIPDAARDLLHLLTES